MRILFITSTRIGDAILSTGLLNHLLEKYPTAQFTIAAGRVAAPLFEAFPNLERLIAVDKKPMSLHWLDLWSKVVWKKWDMVVDLRRSAITQMLNVKEAFVAPRHGGDEHKVIALAQTLNLETPPSPKIWTHDIHARKAARLLPKDTTILAIGPTANWMGKVWPADRFVKLAKKLTSESGLFPNAKIAILGAGAERVMVKSLLDLLPNTKVIDLVGECDLLTTYEVIKRCDMFIGNDSGLMHLAAASGTPTLGLFGPSRDVHYAPWGDNTMVVRTDMTYEQIVTDPAYNRHLPKSYMTSLPVEKVEAAAKKLWKKAAGQIIIRSKKAEAA